MTRPLRYTGDWPPPEVLQEYPNWDLALDEEGEEDQDDTTLMPEDQQKVVSENTIHTAGDVRLADGRSFPAIVTVAHGEPSSFDYHDGTTWITCRQDYDSGRWIPYEQAWLSPEDRMPTVDFSDSRTLPLRLTTRLACRVTGKPFRLEIRADGTSIELE